MAKGLSVPDGIDALAVGILSDIPAATIVCFFCLVDACFFSKKKQTLSNGTPFAIGAMASILALVCIADNVYFDYFNSRLTGYRFVLGLKGSEVLGNASDVVSVPLIAIVVGAVFVAGWVLTKRENFPQYNGKRNISLSMTFSTLSLVSATYFVAVSQPAIYLFGHTLKGEIAHSAVTNLFASPFKSKMEDFEKNYFDLSGSGLSFETPDKPYTGPKLEGSQNVIFIVMESWNPSPEMDSPYFVQTFDEIRKKALYFNNFYANNRGTSYGLSALLLGYALPSAGSLVSMSNSDRLPSLPKILSDSGYKTAFVYGGDLGFGDRKNFFNENVFDVVIDKDDFDGDGEMMNSSWGYNDEHVFRRALDELNSLPKDSPFFMTILSLSNHSPYDFEDPKSGTYHDDHHKGLVYSSKQLDLFLSNLEQEGFLEDTLVVVTSDHGPLTEVRAKEMLKNWHIPLLIFMPESKFSDGTVFDARKSQIDVPSTVLSMLGMQKPKHWRGGSLFDRAEDQAIAINSLFDLGLLVNDKVIKIYPRTAGAYHGYQILENGEIQKIEGYHPDREALQALYQIQVDNQSYIELFKIHRNAKHTNKQPAAQHPLL
jgi:phosphoglycerol transferase MdoB-like AlkP superfamily enzyme